MNRDLLKRVGMLTAATAACTAGVFGALALNGLRYMRPDGGQLVAAAVGRTGGTHRAVRYGLR